MGTRGLWKVTARGKTIEETPPMPLEGLPVDSATMVTHAVQAAFNERGDDTPAVSPALAKPLQETVEIFPLPID